MTKPKKSCQKLRKKGKEVFCLGNEKKQFPSLLENTDQKQKYRAITQDSFFPKIRKSLARALTPVHTGDPRKFLARIQQKKSSHPFFFRGDFEKFYPSIDHALLVENLLKTWKDLTGKTPTRRLRHILRHELPPFLARSPFPGRGLPIGSPLSRILAEIFLFPLDVRLSENNEVLRFGDDFVVFFRTAQEQKQVLTTILFPTVRELGLCLHPTKCTSGKRNQDALDFLGFRHIGGHLQIQQKRIDQLKSHITALTDLRRKTGKKAIIKKINRKILGFGHYYKWADATCVFAELDAWIRQRVRRKLLHARSQSDRSGNLQITNDMLSEIGLKSLVDIKNKKTRGKNQKKSKPAKKRATNDHQTKSYLMTKSLQRSLREIKQQNEQILAMLSSLEKEKKEQQKTRARRPQDTAEKHK